MEVTPILQMKTIKYNISQVRRTKVEALDTLFLAVRPAALLLSFEKSSYGQELAKRTGIEVSEEHFLVPKVL